MFRDLLSMLEYEAKRRPAVAALVERVHEMTDAEIDAAEVPLPWYRTALKRLAQKYRDADAELLMIAHLDGKVVQGFAPDPLGEMRRWEAGSTWLSMGRGSIEIRTGHLLWLPETGGVWLDTVFSERLDPRIATMTTSLGKVSRSGYKDAIRAYREGLSGPSTPEMQLSPTVGGKPVETSLLAQYGVRFSR